MQRGFYSNFLAEYDIVHIVGKFPSLWTNLVGKCPSLSTFDLRDMWMVYS